MASAPFRTDPRLLRPEDIAALQELEHLRLARGLPGIGQEVREIIGRLTPPEEQKPAIVAPLGAIVFDLDAAPFCPRGWRVEAHKPGGYFAWDPAKVRLRFELDDADRGAIKGTELLKRPTIALAFNANLLDGLLEHTELIPEGWKGKRVYFPNTVYRGWIGNLCVRCLIWNDECRWVWQDSWLESGWFSTFPVAVPASI